VTAHTIVETVRGIARTEFDRRPNAGIGVVTSVHGGTTAHACTVKLRESGVVLPKVPIAVGLLGTAALPAPDDLALVVFANGDLHAPVVVGFLYDDEIFPPDHDSSEAIAFLSGGETDPKNALQVALKTPAGGPRTLTVTLDGSAKVEVTVKDDSIVLAAGDATLELDSGGKGTFKVGDSSVVLKKDGNVTIEAGQKLTLKATTIEIDGDASVKIAGQTIDLN